MFVNGGNKGGQEEQEEHVVTRVFARFQKIDARVGLERPVVVFSAAVDGSKGFFVEQTGEPVFGGDLFHQLHDDLVVIGGFVDVGIDDGKFVLRRRRFVVLCLGVDAQFPEFFVQFFHVGDDAGGDDAEIVVAQLLPFGTARAEEGASAEDEVGALFKEVFVDQKVLLFRSRHGDDLFDFGLAEQVQDFDGAAVEFFDGSKKGRFFVQSLSVVAAKSGGYAQNAVFYKGVAGRVPSGIAAGFEGGA